MVVLGYSLVFGETTVWVGAATANVSPPSGSLAVALVTMALTAKLALVAPETLAVAMVCAWMA